MMQMSSSLHCRNAAATLPQRPTCAAQRQAAAPAQCSAAPRPAAAGQSRRAALLGATCAVLSLASFQQPGAAAVELPQAYVDLVRELTQSLEDSILADLNGAEEREVRRKADPAKNLVRQFVQRWRDAPGVREEESHRLVTDTIQQLGQFYQANGARARLPEELGNQLLQQLYAVEEALPAREEKKLFPF